MDQHSRCARLTRIAIAAAAGVGASAGAGIVSAAAASADSGFTLQGQRSIDEYSFSYDGVLGTSLELIVRAPGSTDAGRCRRRVLGEIERLGGILSTYDSTSEISRVKAGGKVESAELFELLEAYERWGNRTGGAIHVNMAEVIGLWKRSAAADALPSESALRGALDAPLALNVDALGKGYIIDRAVEVAQRIVPAGLLNIGGDIRAWGNTDWLIGVADPRNPAENAPVLAQFTLRNGTVATSGGYARFYVIGGRRYSHVIDPRTGWPAQRAISATVIAEDCVRANAISTAGVVLGGAQGTSLARQYATGHLLVDGADAMWHGGAIGPNPIGTPAPARAGAVRLDTSDSVDAWPRDFQATIKFELTQYGKRPYVAAWVQDGEGKVVRTLAFWGRQPKYERELSYWWQATGDDHSAIQSLSRATRPPGAYSLAWDGKDDQGNPLPKGTYTVFLEINREHGRHVKESVKLVCDDAARTVKINDTSESAASAVEYGPRPGKSGDGGSPSSHAN
jgi:thiamine biosynthesis lipoprotein